MRDLMPDERPRERLFAHGVATLGDAELVAAVLGSGTRAEGVLDLARRLLVAYDGLRGLARADALALLGAGGLGRARAAQLLAAFELGRRAAVAFDARPRLLSPDAAYEYLRPALAGRPTERLVVAALDAGGRPVSPPHAHEGGTRSVAARPADVFREPVLLRAVSVILAHNHPSGDATPSAQDVQLTRQLVEAGRILDLEVADHLVVGDGAFVSLRREGLGFERGPPGRP